MQDWINFSTAFLNSYIESFHGLTEDQIRNFTIKKEHSLRVVQLSATLSASLQFNDNDFQVAYLAALFHDIGRFKQLAEYHTFDDSKSVDHAGCSVSILKECGVVKQSGCTDEELVFKAIEFHNKFELPQNLSERELLHARLLRDADKLDILHVLTTYYTDINSVPNHTLTWELPKGNSVSPNVVREIMAGKLVSKKEVVSELDVKVMQLSWVYDLNFKPSFEYLLRMRFLEKIYQTLPKNDIIIDIFRKVKIFAGNRLFESKN